jgi:hypothetical protein
MGAAVIATMQAGSAHRAATHSCCLAAEIRKEVDDQSLVFEPQNRKALE